MPRFDKNSFAELKEYLYNSYDHDAEFESFICDYGEDCIKIDLFNPFFNVRVHLIFNGINTVLATKGDWHGRRDTIVGIAALDDFSCLRNDLPKYDESTDGDLYLLFEMFSGDKLHIVSKEVIIENIRQVDDE